MALYLLTAVFICCALTLVTSRRYHRLIKDHEYAVQIHPKHRYHRYAAAKAHRVKYNGYDYDEFEMSGLKLGQAIDESRRFITFSGWAKRYRFRYEIVGLAAAIAQEEEASAKTISRDTECHEKCNEKYPPKARRTSHNFDAYAQCFASCWYVADGNMAALSSRLFRDPSFPVPDLNAYKHFMRYLFDALHRENRFTEIKRLYDAQQQLLKDDEWPPEKMMLKFPESEAIVNKIKAIYKDGEMTNKLFLWRAVHGFPIDPKSPIDDGETGNILYGPASCSVGISTPRQAILANEPPSGQAFQGYILRIEIPVNPRKAGTEFDDSLRGGLSVADFTANFGLIDMYANDYADKAHKSQLEVLLYSFPKDWIKIEASAIKEEGEPKLKWTSSFEG